MIVSNSISPFYYPDPKLFLSPMFLLLIFHLSLIHSFDLLSSLHDIFLKIVYLTFFFLRETNFLFFMLSVYPKFSSLFFSHSYLRFGTTKGMFAYSSLGASLGCQIKRSISSNTASIDNVCKKRFKAQTIRRMA